MEKDLINITDDEIQESSERAVSEGPIITDMSDYYSNRIYEMQSQNVLEMEERILSMSASEEDDQEIIESPIRKKRL